MRAEWRSVWRGFGGLCVTVHGFGREEAMVVCRQMDVKSLGIIPSVYKKCFCSFVYVCSKHNSKV